MISSLMACDWYLTESLFMELLAAEVLLSLLPHISFLFLSCSFFGLLGFLTEFFPLCDLSLYFLKVCFIAQSFKFQRRGMSCLRKEYPT